MNAAELLAQVKAEAELIEMGWKKERCSYCGGRGYLISEPPREHYLGVCGCDSGTIWVKPPKK